MIKKLLLVLALLVPGVFSQDTRYNPYTGKPDYVGSFTWRAVGSGVLASRPATCTAAKDMYICIGTGCNAGSRIHYCTATNTWEEQGLAGGSVAWSNVTGTPTTISGYGITDACGVAGCTFTGKTTFIASGTGGAGINTPSGVSPTTCVDGDFWSRTADGHFWGCPSGTAKQIPWATEMSAMPGVGFLRQTDTATPATLSAYTFIDALPPFTFDGGGAQIATSSLSCHDAPAAGTITGWSIVTNGGSSPTVTFDIWRLATGTSAIPTVANTIMGTKPALASGNRVYSTTMTNWCGTGTCTIAAQDTICVNVDASNAANVWSSLTLFYQR